MGLISEINLKNYDSKTFEQKLTLIKGGSEGANDLISFFEFYREAGAQVGCYLSIKCLIMNIIIWGLFGSVIQSCS